MIRAFDRSRDALPRGFTLVELMVVVVIIATIGAMGAVMMRRSISGAAGPSFARTVVAVVHEARHAAMTTGRAARVRIVPGSGTPTQIVSEVLDPTDGTRTTWLPNGTSVAPLRIEFCEPATAVNLTTATPTCPITTSMNTVLCFAANGRVNLTDAATACPGTGSSTASLPSTGTGATIYFRGTQMSNNDVKYKLVVWGLTGLPKLTDQW